MNAQVGRCPLTQRQLIDMYFLDMRAKVLDLAAFLDRMDRAADRSAEDDFRLVALRQALHALGEETPRRAYEVQMLLSDPTTTPREHLDRKGAFGAFDHDRQEAQ